MVLFRSGAWSSARGAYIVSDHSHEQKKRLLGKRRQALIPHKDLRKIIFKGARGSTVHTNILVVIGVAKVVFSEADVNGVYRALNIRSVVRG
jgi:hypothetical protein